MTVEKREGDTCMEILRYLPSKDWPSGSILTYRDGCVYVKQGVTSYISLEKGGVRWFHDGSLHDDDVFKERVWGFNYLPPEFFD